MAKGARLDTALAGKIDEWLLAKWESLAENEQTVWTMNCLVYTGAVSMISWGKLQTQHGKPLPRTERPEEVPSDEDDSEVEEGTDELEDAQGPKYDPDPLPPLTKARRRLANLKFQRQKLRQVAGWLEAELQSVSTNRRRKRPTRQ